MSTSVTVNQNKLPKILGMVTAIIGVIMLVAGASVYVFASSYLKDERITVSADAPAFGGKQVAGPFTAFSQAAIINTHALADAKVETLDPAITDPEAFAKELGNQTYAELGDIANKYKAQAAELSGDAAVEAQAKSDAASAKRTTVMNGSFLRASLFTSVVSFGVAVLVMGVGVTFAISGFAVMKLSDGPVVEAKTTA